MDLRANEQEVRNEGGEKDSNGIDISGRMFLLRCKCDGKLKSSGM